MKLIILDDKENFVAEIEFGDSAKDKFKKVSRKIVEPSLDETPEKNAFRERVRKAVQETSQGRETTEEYEQRLFEQWMKDNPFDPSQSLST